MSWKCFELKYQAKSPIHIGYGAKLGIINRTRYYIPGKTMWGAVTAKIGQEIGDPNFRDLKNLVKDDLIFSYFFIDDGEILHPNFTKEGLKFGSKNQITFGEFEQKFITSYASTAVEKDTRTAEDGSLHEVELIKNATKNGDDPQPVKFLGYLFAKEGSDENNRYSVEFDEDNNLKIKDSDEVKIDNLFSTIQNLQVGGERNYGFGKIELLENSAGKEKLFDQYRIDLDSDKPKLNLEKEEEVIALSHLMVKEKGKEGHFGKFKETRGNLEPLVGREWDNENGKGVGQNTKFEGIGLTPGSIFELNRSSNIDLKPGERYDPGNYNAQIYIDKYGMWFINSEQ